MRILPVSMSVGGFTSAEMTFTLRSLSVLTISVSRPGRSRVLTWTMLKEPVSSSGVTSICVFTFSLQNHMITHPLHQASLLGPVEARTPVNGLHRAFDHGKKVLLTRNALQAPQ